MDLNDSELVQKFQHLYLLGRSATSDIVLDRGSWVEFQHLYLLGRSATAPFKRYRGWGGLVSTPLPSGKVCDGKIQKLVGRVSATFQHLYLLGRSATENAFNIFEKRKNVSTPLPSGKVCDTS